MTRGKLKESSLQATNNKSTRNSENQNFEGHEGFNSKCNQWLSNNWLNCNSCFLET
jgi:hypothetical protein